MYSESPLTLTMLFGFLALLSMFALFAGSIVVLVKLVRSLSPTDPSGAPPWVPPGERDLCATLPSAAPSPDPVTTLKGGQSSVVTNSTSLALLRYGQLLEFDVDPITAIGATLAGVDPASVRTLVECGCSPRLALSILEPDD